MNILYFDCFAGLSGDMNLAAMLDLGVGPDQLRAGLSRLGLDHEFELRVSRDARHGIHGTRVDVLLRQDAEHRHGQDHGPGRNLADITTIIRDSGLDQTIQDTSLAMFRRLAEAESRVHGTTVEQVHLHEVGATGAAILATLTDRFTATLAMITNKTGHGIGHRDSDIPNLLRVYLARVQDEGWSSQKACLLQCNIDDMTAEMLGAVREDLMAAGAMDVHISPIQMKKNRPATCLSLLCARQDETRFAELIFRQTTTLGLKSIPIRKLVLDIAYEQVKTPPGHVTFKHALRNGVVVRSKPKLEDCRKLAARHGIPLVEVYARIGWSRSPETP